MAYLWRYITACNVILLCLIGKLYSRSLAFTPGGTGFANEYLLKQDPRLPRISMTDTLIDDNEEDASIPLIEKAGSHLFRYAILLNRSVEEIAGLSVIPFVEDWIGVPYAFGGNSKEGIDCSGFVQQLVSCLHNISLSRMVKSQFEECRSLLREELQEGDLLFFHTTRPGLSHVGYYLGNNKFIHASTARGVIIDDLCDPYYDKAFRFGGRLFNRNESVSASAND